MIQVSIARRYARALLEVGQESGTADALLEELELLEAEASRSDELRSVLESPLFSRSQRQAVLEAVAEQMDLSPTLRNFLRLLVDRDRTVLLDTIVRLYRDLVDERAGRVRAEVRSALPLTEEEADRLRRALARATGKTVSLEREVDASLIGGLLAQIGDTRFDGSLKTQLKYLRDAALS